MRDMNGRRHWNVSTVNRSKTLLRRLFAAADKRGYADEKIANELGIAPSTIAQYRSGKRKPIRREIVGRMTTAIAVWEDEASEKRLTQIGNHEIVQTPIGTVARRIQPPPVTPIPVPTPQLGRVVWQEGFEAGFKAGFEQARRLVS